MLPNENYSKRCNEFQEKFFASISNDGRQSVFGLTTDRLTDLLTESQKILRFNNIDNTTRTDSVTAFTDSEEQAFFDCNRGDKFDRHFDVVAGHAHFSRIAVGVLQIADDARNVGCAEVELRAIVREERSMTTALVFACAGESCRVSR